MLTKIADFYDDEVDAAVEAMTALLEPMLMVFLGVVIGGLVIAMYLPVFQLAGAVGGRVCPGKALSGWPVTPGREPKVRGRGGETFS